MTEQSDKTQVGISIIICCHNSAKKLTPTLKALSLQENISVIAVELILVDNNSIDDTVNIAQENWKQLGEPFPLNIVAERLPGLSNARAKGIATCKYDYLIFCDDDNWLCENYLNSIFNLFESKKEVAVIGGTGNPRFETIAPEWFQAIKGFGYAVGNEGRITGYTDSVYGAGMAVRKEILKALNDGQVKFILTDRVGKNLSSGGDTEICVLVKQAGFKIWFEERLTFEHELSDSRLNWGYYRKLRYAFGCSGAFLNLYDDKFRIPFKQEALKNYLFYKLRYSHLIILSSFIKKEKYAFAMQQLGRLSTLYFDNEKLKKKLPVALANNSYMASLAI